MLQNAWKLAHPTDKYSNRDCSDDSEEYEKVLEHAENILSVLYLSAYIDRNINKHFSYQTLISMGTFYSG